MSEQGPPVRLAQPEDLPELCRLMAEFHAESGFRLDLPAAEAALARLLGDPTLGRLWLIRHEGTDVGYVAVCFGFSLEYLGRDAFVDDLYIREGFRGRGLGARVLEAVEAESRAAGVLALHLEVGRDNARAQALYRRRGFRDNDRQLLTLRLAGSGPWED